MAAVDVVLSPKFQLRDAMVPSLSVDESANVAVRLLVVNVKFATGGLLTPDDTVTARVIEFVAPPLSVTVSCTLYVPAAA